ncbi:MAG: CDP-alcohol phosphatidyltransferase family protein [Candidatus Aegiribacteria sp.]|nr:CDP-alcohol phosphatidyltransferase family protein [Candidatus Aegiribacteria sp.]
MKGPVINIPNLISLSRIPLAFIACLFLVKKNIILVVVVIFVGVISDVVDGIVARRTDSISDWGKILDPLADKIAIGAFIIMLAILGAVPLWFVILFLARDALIAAGGLFVTKKLGSPPSSNNWGKYTSLSMSLYLTYSAVGYMLDTALWPAGLILAGLDPLGLISLGFVLVSLFVYFSESVKKLRNNSGIASS